MKVQSNSIPKSVSVNRFYPKPGYMEVRLRENVNSIQLIDGITENPDTVFEYDEYILKIKDREGLEADINANFDTYLTEARNIELRKDELLWNRQQLAEYEAIIAELDAALLDAQYINLTEGL
jgi:hypothetical protein